MKIGIIVSVGRTDRYGYQYKDFVKIILNNLGNFADKLLIISTSRYANKKIFLNHYNIEFISNEKSWFKLVNGEEEFSLKILIDNLNFGLKKLQNEGYDICFDMAINQYIPKSSEINLKKSCQKIIKKKRPFTWYYKKYLCGNLLFHADVRLPHVINLTIDDPWEYAVDSIINKKTGEIIRIQNGNYKKYNHQAIRDVPWEIMIQDAREKYEFTVKQYDLIRSRFKSYNPNDSMNNPKFNRKVWMNYMQQKVNNKKLSKEKMDALGKQIQKLRKKDFVSHIFEKNYNPILKSKIKSSFNKIYKKFI